MNHLTLFRNAVRGAKNEHSADKIGGQKSRFHRGFIFRPKMGAPKLVHSDSFSGRDTHAFNRIFTSQLL